MSAYYYLVSSLPTISLREPGVIPPLDADSFIAACLAHVSEDLLMDLQAMLDGEPFAATGIAARQYAQFEAQLTNAVQLRRANARGQGAQQAAPVQPMPHTGWSISVEKAVEQAFAAVNPIAREMALDRARVQYLDELATADPFGDGFLLAYAGKLRLAIRWAGWNVDEGRNRLEALGRLGLDALQTQPAT